MHWTPFESRKRGVFSLCTSLQNLIISSLFKFYFSYHFIECSTFSTWTDPCNKNCDWSSITVQFLVNHRSVKPIHHTGDRMKWPQSGHCILWFLLFSLSILHILRNIIDLNINLYFFFTFLSFQADLTSFYFTKLR